MKRASLTETKNQLSALIDQVRCGETIVILDRGRPVARIEPIQAPDEAADSRLLRLERAGIVRRGKPHQTSSAKLADPVRLRSGASGVAALIAERRESR